MRLPRPLRSAPRWPPDNLDLEALFRKVLLTALYLLVATSTAVLSIIEAVKNIFAPLLTGNTLIGVRKMLCKSKFPVPTYLVLLLACMTSYRACAGQQSPSDQTVWYGGPGQALAFYGMDTGVVFPISKTNVTNDEVFTLEFWVQPRCAFITCTYFTLQNLYLQEFAYTHRDSMHCFGQRFSLVDGLMPGLSGPVDWRLHEYSGNWHHFAFIANATSGTCRIFINAKLLVEAKSNQWLSSLPVATANSTQTPFYTRYARLVMGQLAIAQLFPPRKYSFQGFMDEIRLWGADRTNLLADTMYRGVAIGPPSLRAYWNMDTEPPQVMSGSGWAPSRMSVMDTSRGIGEAGSDGDFQSTEAISYDVRGPSGPQQIVFAPSTAPIVTEAYPWFIHVNSSYDAMNPFELRYLCFDLQWAPVACDPALVNPAYLPYAGQFPAGSFPNRGQLYSLNGTNGWSGLVPGQNVSWSKHWAYQSVEFLITGQFDGFQWRLGETYEGGMVRVYGAPLTAYSPYNQTATFAGSIFQVVGTDPIPIHLSCGSHLGDEVKAAVVVAPSQGQLYQAEIRPSSANGSLEFYPTRQLIQCRDPNAPDRYCLVSHFTNVIFFQPIEDPQQTTNIELQLWFVCTTPFLDGTSGRQLVTINVSPKPNEYEDVTYSKSLVGPNPFALSFDGDFSRLCAYTNDATHIKAISLWVKPALNPQPDVGIMPYPEKQTLIHMLPSNVTTNIYFALTLVRNASSYPDYFIEINNFDTSTGTERNLVAFNSSRFGFVTPDEWTNIVVTYYPGQDVLVGLYFDGSPIASASLGTILAPGVIYVGGLHSSAFVNIFRGEMDELSLWKSPLGAFDVLDLQSENLLRTNDNLLALWSFNEGSGYKTTDSVMNWQLIPDPLAPAHMPLWVPADSSISFSSIQTSISSPQVLTLPVHTTNDDERWRYATYLTQLPANGALYYYSYWNGSTSKRLDYSDLSTLVRISSTFDAVNGIFPETVQLWVSGVQNFSSSREPPIGTNYWSAQKIIGPPPWWKADGSGSPVYGNSTESWCPSPNCIANNQQIEWIEVIYSEYLYLTNVEVFQNLDTGAITKISAWDEVNSSWRTIYEGEVKLLSAEYATLAPLFCPITSFVTRVIRVELKPCNEFGYSWRQLEAIRISGLRTLPAGVVGDAGSRVVYVPDSKKPGTDVITYTASQCPLTPRSISPSFSYSLKLAAGTVVKPIATSGTVDVNARGLTLLQLPAYSADSSVTHFQRIISRFPQRGVLYDALDGGHGALKPGRPLSMPGPTLVSNPDGYVFYYSPSKCQYNLTSFEYYVSAQGQISDPAVLTINSLCKASFLNYTRWLGVLLLIITLVAIAYAVLFGLFTIVKRKKKSFEEDRPLLLLLIAAGVIIAYASLFFEFAPRNSGYCLARLWILHLGCMIVVAGSLAFTLLVWNDFSLQSLRSNSSNKVVTSAIVLPVLAVLIELALLIVFSIVNTPTVSHTVSPSNGAISIASCKDRHFSWTLILLNKAAWVFAIFIISAIILSVSLTAVRSAVVMLASSLLGLICGIVFVIALYSVKDPDVRLLLKVISLVIPFSALLSLLLVGKFSSLVKPAAVETTEFGLQPISSPQKSSSRTKVGQHETAANVQMTRGMNNHSVDKSVNALLDTVQDKEREIALLKRKLLKRHYRIRELQQKLSDTVEGSQMMYSQAAPSDYGEDYAE